MKTGNRKINIVEHCGLCSSISDRVQFAAKKSKENDSDAASRRIKGIIGRYLDRLAKANEREFGKGGGCCH